MGRITKRVVATGAAALLLLGLLASATLAGHQASGVQSLTGCLLGDGTLVQLAVGTTPAEPCGERGTQVHLSGGDITGVQAGTGLAGGGTEGVVSVTIDPTKTQRRVTGTCGSAGSAIRSVAESGAVACRNGPWMRFGATNGGKELETDYKTIGTLSVPAGNHLVTAKVVLKATKFDPANDVLVGECRLRRDDSTIDYGIVWGDNDVRAGGTITMIGTISQNTASTLRVQCRDNAKNNNITAHMGWSWLRMTAIRMDNIHRAF